MSTLSCLFYGTEILRKKTLLSVFHYIEIFLKSNNYWGTWVAQSVTCVTFSFGSGHDVRVVRSSPISLSLSHRSN